MTAGEGSLTSHRLSEIRMSGLSKAVLLLAGVSTANGFVPATRHAPGASPLGRFCPEAAMCTRSGAVSGLGMKSTTRAGGPLLGLSMRTAHREGGAASRGADPFSVVKVTHACPPVSLACRLSHVADWRGDATKHSDAVEIEDETSAYWEA